MLVVNVGEDVVQGETAKEIAIILRNKHRWTLQRIADVFGFTRENVRLYFKHIPENQGIRQYPELNKEETFLGKEDWEVAVQLGLPVSRVSNARRKLNLKKFQPVNLTQRRNYFVKTLFGKNYIATKKFSALFQLLTVNLTPYQFKLTHDFYISGGPDSIERRNYRKWIFDKIRAEVKSLEITPELAQEKGFLELKK